MSYIYVPIPTEDDKQNKNNTEIQIALQTIYSEIQTLKTAITKLQGAK
jgi:hypothetical protein